MINKLINLANKLDESGFKKEADGVDLLIIASKDKMSWFEKYINHTALNAGQAARVIIGPYDKSLKERLMELFNNFYYAAIPPWTHHTEEEMEAARMMGLTAWEWFLCGYMASDEEYEEKCLEKEANGVGAFIKSAKPVFPRNVSDKVRNDVDFIRSNRIAFDSTGSCLVKMELIFFEPHSLYCKFISKYNDTREEDGAEKVNKDIVKRIIKALEFIGSNPEECEITGANKLFKKSPEVTWATAVYALTNQWLKHECYSRHQIDNMRRIPRNGVLGCPDCGAYLTVEGLTAKDVHSAASAAGIEWDNNEKFMNRCEELVGKRHLDDMTKDQLHIIIMRINDREFYDDQ